MISQDKLMQILIKGRYECYVKKSSAFNPYQKSEIYDWEFSLEIDGYVFTDAYRGFNPYSGTEVIYQAGSGIPVWTCDYVGYVVSGMQIPADMIYEFLKESRGAHLKNCGGNLFSEYSYMRGLFGYQTYFQGEAGALLQIEEYFYQDKLAARQVTAGRMTGAAEGDLT